MTQPNATNFDIHKKQSLVLAIAIILFILAIGFGILNGFSLGKDQATYKNVQNLYAGLNYFYNDQGAYPTANQFNNQILAPYYMSAIPVPDNIQGSCKNFTQYVYTQLTPSSYNLQFCLNNAIDGFKKGINTIKNG